jgi:predicted kinase
MNASLQKFNDLDIVLLCGIYGSGKTEFAERHFRDSGRHRVSRTEIRKLMYEMTHFGDQWKAEHFSEEDDVLVKHIERKIMEHYIHNRRKLLVINTFATRQSRQRFIAQAKESKKTIGAVFLNQSLAVCLAHYRKHNPSMPEYIVTSMHQKIELPDRKEGFSEVMVLAPQ